MNPIRTLSRSSRKPFLLALATLITAHLTFEARAQTLFWSTSNPGGTWTTTADWGTSAAGPFNTTWVSGDSAVFSGVASAITFASTSVNNITVGASDAVTWTSGGTFTSSGTNSVSTILVGAGGTLTWSGTQALATGTGFVMGSVGGTNTGTWAIGSTITTAYTGGLTLNSGTISVSSGSAPNTLGAGTFTINGGILASTGSKTYAVTSFVVGSGATVTFTGTGTSTWSAPVTLSGSTPVTMALGLTSGTDTDSETFNGVISGAAGATLNIQGVSSGTYTFVNTANTFSGGVNITANELDVAADGSLGTAPSTPTVNITINGGRLANVSGNSFTINSNRTIALGNAAATNIDIKGTSTVIYNGVMQDLTTGGIFVKQGGGILQLGGANTYTGATSVNNGTVQLGVLNSLPTGTTLSVGQSASPNLGTFDLNGFNQTIAGLNSTTGTNATTTKNMVTSTTTASVLTMAGAGSYSYGSFVSSGIETNSGVIAGPLSLVMAGAGTQILGDVNTYTGSTSVQKGDLNISGSIVPGTVVVTPTGTNTATLSSGATGTLSAIAPTAASGNAVVIGGGGAGSSAILAPGDSANSSTLGQIGNINFTLQPGTHLDFAVNSTLSLFINGASQDLLNFTAAPASGEWLTGAGDATLQLNGTINYGSTYIVAEDAIATGTTGTFTFANITGYNTTNFQAQVTQSGNNYVLSFNSVPEPSPALSILVGACALGLMGRFRRRLA